MKVLVNNEQGIRNVVNNVMAVGFPAQVTIKRHKETRSVQQNRKAHAMFRDLSEQVEWYGSKFPPHVWKRLCTAAMLREKGEKPELIPALDGAGVDIIYEKTSDMKVDVMADLIEWTYAFGAEKGVHWSDPTDIINAQN